MDPDQPQGEQTVVKPLPCDWTRLNQLRKEQEKKKTQADEEAQQQEPALSLP